jgi:TolA-binding protein
VGYLPDVAALTSTVGIVALVGCAAALVALAVAGWLAVQLRRLRAAQRAVIGEHGDKDLVAHAAQLEQAFRSLHGYVEDVAARLDTRLGMVEERLDGTVAYHGLVRYDAYNEMSGRQSTSIALLDGRRSGVVLSSIHHREQARLYAKLIREGEGELQLSPEEAEAIRQALGA